MMTRKKDADPQAPSGRSRKPRGGAKRPRKGAGDKSAPAETASDAPVPEEDRPGAEGNPPAEPAPASPQPESPDAPADPAAEATAEGADAAALPPHPWEEMLSNYPLRSKEEDPRWAIRTVWGWVGVALFSLVFILVLMVLGLFYD